MKKLAILICSLHKRKHFLDKLLAILNPQITDEVEIIIETDNGEMSIGDKRNKLLERANQLGNKDIFICFVDDDDRVSNSYVYRILQAINQNPECVGMEGIITFDGKNPRIFIHSNKYDHWYEENGKYYRTPNHLNPVKIEYALKVKFPGINSGEDHDYSNRLFEHLKGKKEIYLNGPVYFYDYVTNK